MVDPFTAGLIGWACGKLCDRVLTRLVSDTKLTRAVNKAVAQWAGSLTDDQYVHPNTLFSTVDHSTAMNERPEYCALQVELLNSKLPSKEMWHGAFMESWHWVRDNVVEPQASMELKALAEVTHAVCVKHEPVFRTAVIDKLDDIVSRLDEIGEYFRTILSAEADKGMAKPLWPKFSLPFGGAKVSEPFAGRREELGELTEAMGADKTIAAVVGMVGQGKSCLAGEWYKRGARPPEGVGLFWRKVYEPGLAVIAGCSSSVSTGVALQPNALLHRTVLLRLFERCCMVILLSQPARRDGSLRPANCEYAFKKLSWAMSSASSGSETLLNANATTIFQYLSTIAPNAEFSPSNAARISCWSPAIFFLRSSAIKSSLRGIQRNIITELLQNED